MEKAASNKALVLRKTTPFAQKTAFSDFYNFNNKTGPLFEWPSDKKKRSNERV